MDALQSGESSGKTALEYISDEPTKRRLRVSTGDFYQWQNHLFYFISTSSYHCGTIVVFVAWECP
jgi:hypothetical protein